MPKKHQAVHLLNLKSILKKLGISQRQLAEQLKLSYARVNSVVNCKTSPSLSMTVSLARHLGLPIEDLLKKPAPENTPTPAKAKKREMTWADL